MGNFKFQDKNLCYNINRLILKVGSKSKKKIVNKKIQLNGMILSPCFTLVYNDAVKVSIDCKFL